MRGYLANFYQRTNSESCSLHFTVSTLTISWLWNLG